MQLDHKKSNEAGYVHDYASVKQYACLSCDNTGSSFTDGAPFCERCQRYMVQSGFIQDSKVIEIKNRKLDLAKGTGKQAKRGRKGRAEDGLIAKAVWGTVYPRSDGSDPLRIAVNMDDEMFIKGAVMVKWGALSFMTDIYEIGNAFAPFDSMPISSLKEDGVNLATGETMYTPVTIPKRIVKRVTKIGPLEVHGGYSRKAFDEMFAVFTWGKQRATFCMADVCQILAKVL